MRGEQLSFNFNARPIERSVNVIYTDEAGHRMCRTLIPTNISFGRGSWWLEAASEKGDYVRLRLTSIEGVRKVPS